MELLLGRKWATFLGIKTGMKTDVEIRQEGEREEQKGLRAVFLGQKEADKSWVMLRVLRVIRCRGE